MNEVTPVPTSKVKLIYSIALSPLMIYFEPYSVLVKAIGVLVALDIISGMIASRKEHKPISSRRFLRKIPQVALFLFGLAAAKEASPLLMEFGIEAHQAGKWFCALYGIYEFFSILENLGRLGLPIAKQFSALLQSKLPEDIQKELPKEPTNVQT